MVGMHADATGTCDLHPFKETFFRRSNALREAGRRTRKRQISGRVVETSRWGPANLDVNHV